MKFAVSKLALCALIASLAGCSTTGTTPSTSRAPSSPLPDAGPQNPVVGGPSVFGGSQAERPAPIVSEPISVPDQGVATPQIYETLSAFETLPHWPNANPVPALKAFRRSCALWAKRDGERWLFQSRPEYGQYKDWEASCFTSDYINDDAASARKFFETYFSPVTLTTSAGQTGLLTGYYEPEVSVRRRADAVYSEPILGLPHNDSDRAKPRSQITANIAPVLAYGKPIDVFFMQIQGSGRLRFDDGQITRAAFAAHNGQLYTSIGKVLVQRGEMTLQEASKQSIESWMNRHSAAQVRELMNNNARYVFFSAERIDGSEGPKGAMGLPLEGMGSLAIDPAFHPYGALVWLETTLPQSGGDYIGQSTGVLLSMQDTGGAIKGPMRGDVFFGSGDEAGNRAGVMKHQGEWTLFLPSALALQYLASL